VAQKRGESAGRPGSALLILVAIFTTALFLRVPIGLGPAEPIATVLDVETISIWSAPPILPMHPPALDVTPPVPAIVRGDKPSAFARSASAFADASADRRSLGGGWSGLSIPGAPAATLEPIGETRRAAVSEIHQPEMSARPGAASQPPVVPEPALASTSHRPMTGFASPVAPDSYVAESPSRPFGAVGTAFVKTGAALSLAFKKTGQGILAPF
jgi:hypothetical protein